MAIADHIAQAYAGEKQDRLRVLRASPDAAADAAAADFANRRNDPALAVNFWKPAGWKYENFSRIYTQGVTDLTVVTTAELLVSAGPVLQPNDPVTVIGYISGATALAVGTRQWACILHAETGAVLGVSADKTSEAWAGTTLKEFTIATPVVVSQPTPVYIGLLVAASTMPSLRGTTVSATAGAPSALTPWLSKTAVRAGLSTPATLGDPVPLGGGSVAAQLPYILLR